MQWVGGGAWRAQTEDPRWVGASSLARVGLLLVRSRCCHLLPAPLLRGIVGSSASRSLGERYLSFFPLPFLKVGVKRVRIGVGWQGALRVRRGEAAMATEAAGSRRRAFLARSRPPALPPSALRM